MASFLAFLFLVGSVIGKFERGRYIACYDREDHGASYKGVENKAEDGRSCVNWGQAISAGAAQAWKVPARQNYCRNPNGSTGLWCYTAIKQKQPCSVPACNGVPIKISPEAVNSSQALMTRAGRTLSAGNALLPDDQLTVQRNWQMCFWSLIRQTLAWWKADLKSVYLVKSVGFYSTSSGRRYNGLQIHVGNGSNTEKQCGKTFAHTGTSFNDTVYLDCGNGIHGRYVTISKSNELVICEIQINVDKKKCSNVSSHPSFLVVSKEGDGRVGSLLKYTCNSSCHQIIGNKHRECVQSEGESSAVWSGEEPTCQIVSCQDAPSVSNAVVDYRRKTCGGIATYSCDQGFILDGDSILNCSSNGTWTGTLPVCRGVQCNMFTLSDRVVVNSTEYSYPNVINFSCMSRRHAVALTTELSVIKCQSDGNWSHPIPDCRRPFCELQKNVKNGKMWFHNKTRRRIYADQTAQFSCDSGYKLNGSRAIACVQVNDEYKAIFNALFPTCEAVTCTHLPGLFTLVNSTGNTYNEIAHYKCRNGYHPQNPQEFKCESDGQWKPISELILCSPVACLEPSIPEHGFVEGNYTFGYNVSFHCYYGYKLQGDQFSQCQADGTWSPALPPSCKKISCGSPRKIENGEVEPSINETVNSTAIYSCRENHEIHGNKSVKCEVNQEGEGEWEEPPVCKPVNCGHPENVTNGELQGDSYDYLAVVRYSCHKGYEVASEDMSRTCQSNGNWSGRPLTCQGVKCRKPNSPLFGYHKLLLDSEPMSKLANESMYTFQQNVSFHCFYGFKLQGNTLSQCQASGTWSPALPLNCTSISCGFPPKVDKGKVEPSINGTVNSTAVYSCHENHELHGNETVKCLLNKEGQGEWEKPPQCQPVNCGHPGNIPNGKFQGNSFVHSAVVNYNCNEGYEAVSGDENRMCQGNRSWSGKLLTCRRVIYGKPTDPLFGYHQLLSNDYDFGSQVRFICYLGYELKGEAVVSCNSSGKWHPNIPTCTVLHCPMLVNNTLRRVRVLGREVNDTAIYTCIKGYELLGSSRRTCSVRDGKTFWTSQPPSCTPKKCPKPSSLSNRKIIGDDYFYKRRIIFQCSKGYFLSGGSNAWYCNENGEWQDQNEFTGDFPRCEAVDCGIPSVPEYGVFEGKNHKFGGVVTYTCNHGFKREGAARAQCMANGRWSASSPNCTRLTCSFLKPPKNGRFIPGGNSVGSTVKFSCNPGYDIKIANERLDPGIEEFVVKCKQFDSQHLASSAWTGPTRRFSSVFLVCQAKDCGTLPTIRLAKISYEPSTLFGSKARYECIGGYEITSGDAVRFCLTNGTWNGTEPKCTARCGNPRILPGHFEFVNSTGISFGDIAFYRCGKRHLPKIPQKFKCESDGQWKPTEKSMPCNDIDCGRPADPMFGYQQKLSKDYTFRSQVRFRCYFGYKLSSGAVSICGSSGKWQPSPPNCTVVSCSKLPDVPSATIEVTGTQVNDSAIYKCNKGYKLLGSSHRSCLVHPQNGKTFWTSSAPQCYSDRCPEHGSNNKSDYDRKEKESSNFKDEKCRKCCKMAAKTNREICAQNQYIFVAEIMNVTKSVPGSAEYQIRMHNLIKGKGHLIKGVSLKLSRNGECSNVECSPLKKNQKYFFGGQKYKNGQFILRQSGNSYVEMAENNFRQKKSRIIKHCSGRI